MQTNFTDAQLQDPAIAEADRILRRCVHCGLCTATCPTYVVLGDERDSPRGRIYAIKDMLESDADVTPERSIHIDRCLSCYSCMTTCPSDVDYMHLLETGRRHIEARQSRPLKDRALRQMLAAILPHPTRFRAVLRLAPMGRRFKSTLTRFGLPEVAAMLDLVPKRRLQTGKFSGAGTALTEAERTGRVIMLAGCAQQVLRPEINDATIRLLARRGVDVVVPGKAECCGALVGHIGMDAAALHAAKTNVDVWWKEIRDGAIDAIVINASGCGTTVKDYGHLLAHDEDYAERAKIVSKLAKDVCEFVASHDIGPPQRWSSLKVAYHAPCSLQHGQRVVATPRDLLTKAGFSVVELPEAHLCCGSAGVYNVLQPAIAGELKDRKTAHIKAIRPDIVATGNIGCMTQLQSGLDIPVVHTIELLDWAYGGPVPPGLEAMQQFSTNVPIPVTKPSVSDYISA